MTNDLLPGLPMARRLATLTLCLALLLSALAGCGLTGGGAAERRGGSGALGGLALDPPIALPPVTMEDSMGRPFDLRREAAGRLTSVFFGYTHCPDVCPVFLSTLAAARTAIDSGPGSRPLVLFVTVDPVRDTSEVLRSYLGAIDDTVVGLRGSTRSTARLLRALRLPPAELDAPDQSGDYAVLHPARATVFSPDGLARRAYPSDTRQRTWVADLPRLDR